jgi:hypothetical protein
MADDDRPRTDGDRPASAGGATPRVVYLMRGLPCCGKSTTARVLAGESGVICETDAYFYLHVGDDPARYDYRPGLLGEARRWNFGRFRRAVDAGASPVVVDRGNSLCLETRAYARYAVEHGYRVELKEPESAWWREIRGLLADEERNRPALERWAGRLATMSRSGHRVPASTIRHWMSRWKHGLTVEDILGYEPEGPAGATATVTAYVLPPGLTQEFGSGGQDLGCTT